MNLWARQSALRSPLLRSFNKHKRHPEEPPQAASRRMKTSTEPAAILRDARREVRRAPQDDGGDVAPKTSRPRLGALHELGAQRLAPVGRRRDLLLVDQDLRLFLQVALQ